MTEPTKFYVSEIKRFEMVGKSPEEDPEFAIMLRQDGWKWEASAWLDVMVWVKHEAQEVTKTT